MTNPLLYCPECGVYFTKHAREASTCSFVFFQGDNEAGWMPKDQSPRGVASRASNEAFKLYKQ